MAHMTPPMDIVWEDSRKPHNVVINFPYEDSFFITSGYEHGKTYHVSVKTDGTITFNESRPPEKRDEGGHPWTHLENPSEVNLFFVNP